MINECPRADHYKAPYFKGRLLCLIAKHLTNLIKRVGDKHSSLLCRGVSHKVINSCFDPSKFFQANLKFAVVYSTGKLQALIANIRLAQNLKFTIRNPTWVGSDLNQKY